MRYAALALAVTACGSGDPDCKSAVEGAARRFAHAGAPEVTTLIGECTQRGWSARVRSCFGGAKDGKALEDCLPPLDVEVPPPIVKPSPETSERASKAKDVRALLFYAPEAEVVPLLDAYFKALGVAVEHHDRILEPDNAKRYNVTRDGVVLVRGDRHEDLEVDARLKTASRFQLPRFDRKVEDALALLMRTSKHAYLTIGHGELNDRASLPPALAGTIAERRTTVLHARLEARFQLATLAPATLATDVPADANVVVLLAPAQALSAAELAALGRYLDRGGALLFALDPTSPPGLGALEDRLGVTFDHGHLVDDKSYLVNKREPADRRLVLTTKLGTHPSTQSAARAASPIILIDSGTLAATTSSRPAARREVTFTVQSMPSSFIDTNGNFELDGSEHRQVANVAAAIRDGDARVILLADADLLADVIVPNAGRASVWFSSPPFVEGALQWISGEETFFSTPSRTGIDEIETKAGLVVERELLDRRRVRLLARSISAPEDSGRDAATEARHLERDLAELREKIDAAKD